MTFTSTILRAAVLLILAAAGAAQAQDAADPIGGLLEQAQDAPNPLDPEGESVPAPPSQAPTSVPPPTVPAPAVGYALPPVDHASPIPPAYAPPAVATPATPYVAPYAPPPRPRLTEPVHIDEIGKTPDAPPSPVDQVYEARLRASSASAQGLQGPLDGAWTLKAAGGGALYSLLLVDNGYGLEGAWRDPRRRGAVDSSGFLSDIQRTGSGVSMSFYPAPGAGLAILTLSPAGADAWTGELAERGERRPVTLRRD